MESYDQALLEMRRDQPNLKLAKKLLLRSIEAGDGRAMYALATWYLHGLNVEKNFKKARRMLINAAKFGSKEALFDLAVCSEKGLGVTASEKKAFKYYLQAALMGDGPSRFEVGRMLYYGIGTLKDKTLANQFLDVGEDIEKSRHLDRLYSNIEVFQR